MGKTILFIEFYIIKSHLYRSPCNNGVCVCPAKYTGTFCGFGEYLNIHQEYHM